MGKKVVTQEDIAKALGYSRVTVSKVLNGYGQTGAETKRRVLRTAREMGYFRTVAEPEPMLQNGRRVVFICFDRDFHNNYWTAVIRGVSGSLSRAGIALGLSLISEETADRLLSDQTDNSVIGYIIAGALPRTFVELLCTVGKPIVSLDIDVSLYCGRLPIDVVLPDSLHAFYTITAHLADQGYRRFAYFGSKNTVQSFRERWEGFLLALSERGIDVPPYWMTLVDHVRGFSAVSVLEEALAGYPEFPEVVVCQNDSLVAAIGRYGREHGLDWIQNALFVGFDHSLEFASHTQHDYNVDCYPEEIGRTAVDTLLWRLNHLERPVRVVRTAVQPRGPGDRLLDI